MPRKIPSPKNLFPKLVFFLVFFCSVGQINAQCAGDDGTLVVCDYENPANQNIDLFSLLQGTPTPGGTWSDPLQTGALTAATGILNVWNIHLSGSYVFNYTVANVAGCADTTASVTVTVGGYSGITSPNGSACSDDSHVNLFEFFVGTPPSPQLNGTWTDNNATGALNGNILDATASGLGTFSFTYTMPEIGTCPARSSTAFVTVHRAPIPGNPADLMLCDSDDLSVYANLNLFDQLGGEDPGGLWTESGTSELSGMFDSTVNVQNIYNTFGPGTYSFTYSVYPTNPVCDIKKATVKIIIEHQLDFTGATFTVNSDICETEIATATYSAVLTQGPMSIPDGTYQLTYQITGPVSNSATINATFTSGFLSFPIPKTSFPQVGDYTVSITAINDVASLGICTNVISVSDVLHVYPTPKLDTAVLTIAPVCKNSDVIVTLSNSILANGNYQVTYNLSGANSASAQTATFNIVGGTATFTIPAALVPNSGSTSISVTFVMNTVTLCSNAAALTKSFTINDAPDVSGLQVSVADYCKNGVATVQVSGLGTMTNLGLKYTISGANTVAEQSVTVTASGGTASFTILSALLPNTGISIISITSITNTTTGCVVPVTTVFDSFTINELPAAPTASGAVYCSTENKTVADLLPSGTNYSWYNFAANGVALPNDQLLVTGDYYVSETNPITGCTSPRTRISITVNILSAPTITAGDEQFCGADKPTLQELSARVNAAETVIWYDAASGGNQLPNSTLLQEGVTYYGFQFSTTLNCTSDDYLAVSVSLTKCDEDPGTYDFFIPDGFSPNNDGVNDTFRIPQIEFLFPNYTLEIFNRYGNVLFKGNINKPSWDGKNTESSNLLDGVAPNGVYFYVIHFNKDNKPPKQGRLYLNR